MSQPNKKPCIQGRIKTWFPKSKWFWTIVLVAVIISVSEVFGFGVLDFFAQLMRDFENMFPEAFRGIVTFLSGALSFAFGRYIYDEYRKPKLEIVRVDPLSSRFFKTWRVIVKNKGKTAAENCTGSIHLSGKDANGKDINLEGSVCWSTLGNPRVCVNKSANGQRTILPITVTTKATEKKFDSPNLFLTRTVDKLYVNAATKAKTTLIMSLLYWKGDY